MVSGVSVPDCILGKTWRQMVVVCLFFEKMLRMCIHLLYGFCCLRYLYGIYLVIHGFPMLLPFISVIWKVCLNGLLKSLFCSIVRVGTRKVGFFQFF